VGPIKVIKQRNLEKRTTYIQNRISVHFLEKTIEEFEGIPAASRLPATTTE
jgi:hypothetical protein